MKMKIKLMAFVAGLLTVLPMTSAWAGGTTTTYYAALKASVSNTGGGKVYAGTSETAGTYAASSTSANQSSTTQDDVKTFYAFAQANEGFEFAGWSDSDGGAVNNTENPRTVTVKCSSSSESSPTTTTVWANFKKKLLAAFGITFETSDAGTYTVGGGVPANMTGLTEATSIELASSDPNFLNWKVNDADITDNPYTATCLADTTISAVFLTADQVAEATTFADLTAALANDGKKKVIIPDGKEIVVAKGETLTVPAGKQLTVEGKLIVEGTLANSGALLGQGKIYKISKKITQGEIITPVNGAGGAYTDWKYRNTTVETISPTITGADGVSIVVWGVLYNGDKVAQLSKQSPKAIKVSVGSDAINTISLIADNADKDEVDSDEHYVLFADCNLTGPIKTIAKDNSKRLNFQGWIDCAGHKISHSYSRTNSDFNAKVLNGTVSFTPGTDYQNATAKFVNCGSITVKNIKGTACPMYFYDCGTEAKPTSLTFGYNSSAGTRKNYFYSGYYTYSFSTGKDNGNTEVRGGSFTTDPTAWLQDVKDANGEDTSLKAIGPQNNLYKVVAKPKTQDLAEANGKVYQSLQTAVDEISANTPTTLKLKENVVLEEQLFIPADKSLTIDLDGHDISGASIANSGALRVEDNSNQAEKGILSAPVVNSGNGTIDLTYGQYAGKFTLNGGTLTTHGGTFTSTFSYEEKGGVAKLRGGTYKGVITVPEGHELVGGVLGEVSKGVIICDNPISSADVSYTVRGLDPEDHGLGVSDFDLYSNNKHGKSGWMTRSDFAGRDAQWDRLAELKCTVEPVESKAFEATLTFDRPIAAESVIGMAMINGIPNELAIDTAVSAGEDYHVFIPLVVDYGYTAISYKYMFNGEEKDRWAKMECGVKNNSLENIGTTMTLKFQLRTETRAAGYDTSTNPVYDYTYTTCASASYKFTGKGAIYGSADYDSLADALAEANYSGAVKLSKDCAEVVAVSKAGSFVLDRNTFAFTGEITAGDCYAVTATDLGDGKTQYDVKLAAVTVGIPTVANTTLAVTASEGEVKDLGNDQYQVAPGATVTATYTPNEGYFGEKIVKTIASAAEGAAVTVTDEEAASVRAIVAKIGGTPYASLAEAIEAAAESGATIDVVKESALTVAEGIELTVKSGKLVAAIPEDHVLELKDGTDATLAWPMAEGAADHIIVTGGRYSADPSAFLADGLEAKEKDGKWVVGVKVVIVIDEEQEATEENTAEKTVMTGEQTSTVDEEKVAEVINDVVPEEKREELVENIKTSTKVEGVKLTTVDEVVVPDETKPEEKEVVKESGVKAVVLAAKAAAQETAVAAADKTDGEKTQAEKDAAAFKAALEQKEKDVEITVKVEVKAKLVEYVPPAEAAVQEAPKGTIKFELKPEAVVTVAVKDETPVQQVVPVSNDMIDQKQKIKVSMYAGFKPVQVLHRDDNGTLIEEFTGDAIGYGEATRIVSVMISHFSTVEMNEASVDPYAPGDAIKVADGFYQNAATYTDSTEFYITSKAGLEYFRDLVNNVNGEANAYAATAVGAGFDVTSIRLAGKTVKLLADIDLNNEVWTPIGRATDKDMLGGTFDGNKHVVSNLKTVYEGTADDKDKCGFFGYSNKPCTIQNLTLENVDIKGLTYVGAVISTASSSEAKIINCHVTGLVSIEAAGNFVGGIVGHGQCSVSNCSVEATSGKGIDITGGGIRIGGIYGYAASNTGVVIENCSVSNLKITLATNYIVGGIVGSIEGGATVSRCSVENLTIDSKRGPYVGYVVGNLASKNAVSAITDCTVANSTLIGRTDKFTTQEETYTVQNGDHDCPNAYYVGSGVSVDANGKMTGGTFEYLPDVLVAAGYEKVAQGTTPETWVVQEKAVAKIGEQGYPTLAAAIAAVKEGETIELLAGTIEEGEITLPDTIKNVTIKGAADHASILKNTTLAHRTNGKSFDGLTIDGVVFDNGRFLVVEWGNGSIKNLTFTNNIFSDLDDGTSEAAVHLNVNAAGAVSGFTFENNVIDGCTGGQKSGIYGAVKGNTTIRNNTINNVAFRPICVQIIDTDGEDDNTVVTGNTFSGSSVGRLQIYGTENETTCAPEGTDGGSFIVNNNIFKDITSQQICCWGINTEKVTTDITGNYYDVADPKMFWNDFNDANSFYVSDTDNAALLPHANHDNFNYYTGLTEAGEIDPATLVEVIKKNYVAEVVSTGKKFATVQEAVDAAEDGAVVMLISDISYDYPTASVLKNGSYTASDKGKTLTLDLNGHAITAKINATFNSVMRDLIYNNGDLTVQDSVGTGSITITESNDTSWGQSMSIFGNTGKLTILSGTYCNNGAESMSYVVDNRCGWCGQGAELEIVDGVFKCPIYTTVRAYQQASDAPGTQPPYDACTVYVSGGTFEGKRCFYLQQPNSVALATTKVDITGGSFTAAQRVFQMDVSGLDACTFVNISDGEFACADASGNSIFHMDTVYADEPVPGSAVVSVSGGAFACGQGVVFDPLTGKEAALAGEVSGGIFSADPSEYVAEGCVAVQNTDAETSTSYPWMIGIKVEGDKTALELASESHVDDTQFTDVPEMTFEEKTELVEKISQNTEVVGVKLTTEAEKDESGVVITPSGVQAVIDKAKENAAFAAALAESTLVTVKVDVVVTPVAYTKPTELEKTGSIKFKLEPKAVVSVNGKEVDPQTVPVTNEMIDQSRNISVTVYAGFEPAQVIHMNGTQVIETFSGDDIVFDEASGNVTVTISHFSELLLQQKANVARVDGTDYTDLAEAIAAADGKTVSLLADVELDAALTVAAGKSVTIDFAGKKLSWSGVATDEEKAKGLIVNSGTLAMVDGSDLANGGLNAGTGVLTTTADDGATTIASGYYDGTLAGSGNVLVSGGSFNAAVPAANCAPGYEAGSVGPDGRYGVAAQPATISAMTTSARDPWNGLVDIVVTLTSKTTATLAVSNVTDGVAIPTADLKLMATDGSLTAFTGSVAGTDAEQTLHLVWDSATAVPNKRSLALGATATSLAGATSEKLAEELALDNSTPRIAGSTVTVSLPMAWDVACTPVLKVDGVAVTAALTGVAYEWHTETMLPGEHTLRLEWNGNAYERVFMIEGLARARWSALTIDNTTSAIAAKDTEVLPMPADWGETADGTITMKVMDGETVLDSVEVTSATEQWIFDTAPLKPGTYMVKMSYTVGGEPVNAAVTYVIGELVRARWSSLTIDNTRQTIPAKDDETLPMPANWNDVVDGQVRLDVKDAAGNILSTQYASASDAQWTLDTRTLKPGEYTVTMTYTTVGGGLTTETVTYDVPVLVRANWSSLTIDNTRKTIPAKDDETLPMPADWGETVPGQVKLEVLDKDGHLLDTLLVGATADKWVLDTRSLKPGEYTVRMTYPTASGEQIATVKYDVAVLVEAGWSSLTIDNTRKTIPAKDDETLPMPADWGETVTGQVKLEVLDKDGNVLDTKWVDATADKWVLDTRSLKPGAYTVRMTYPTASGEQSATVKYDVAVLVEAGWSSLTIDNTRKTIPAKDDETLPMPADWGETVTGQVKLEVLDKDGNVLDTLWANPGDAKWTLDTRSLMPGAYTVRMTYTAGGQQKTETVSYDVAVLVEAEWSSLTIDNRLAEIPAKDTETLALPAAWGESPTEVRLTVLDADGKVVHSETVDGAKKSWSWSTVPVLPGRYTVTIDWPGATGDTNAVYTIAMLDQGQVDLGRIDNRTGVRDLATSSPVFQLKWPGTTTAALSLDGVDQSAVADELGRWTWNTNGLGYGIYTFTNVVDGVVYEAKFRLDGEIMVDLEDGKLPVEKAWYTAYVGEIAEDATAKSLDAKLKEATVNGAPYWQNYVLGWNPSNADERLLIRLTGYNKETGKLSALLEGKKGDRTEFGNFQLNYILRSGTDRSGAGWSATAPQPSNVFETPFTATDGQKYYKGTIILTPKE